MEVGSFAIAFPLILKCVRQFVSRNRLLDHLPPCTGLPRQAPRRGTQESDDKSRREVTGCYSEFVLSFLFAFHPTFVTLMEMGSYERRSHGQAVRMGE